MEDVESTPFRSEISIIIICSCHMANSSWLSTLQLEMSPTTDESLVISSDPLHVGLIDILIKNDPS